MTPGASVQGSQTPCDMCAQPDSICILLVHSHLSYLSALVIASEDGYSVPIPYFERY